MPNNSLKNLYTKMIFEVDELFEEEELVEEEDELFEEEEFRKEVSIPISCFGVVSTPMPCFYFLDDDKSELVAGQYKGDYSLIKVPSGFQSVQISGSKVDLDAPLTKNWFGPLIFNIFNTQEADKEEKLFEVQPPGISLQGLGGGACPKLMRYQNNRKQKVFKYRNHFFMPLVLANNTTCFYAFEQEKTLFKWHEKIEEFAFKKALRPDEYENYQLQVAAENPIVYDNILGMLIVKKAKLQKVIVPNSKLGL